MRADSIYGGPRDGWRLGLGLPSIAELQLTSADGDKVLAIPVGSDAICAWLDDATPTQREQQEVASAWMGGHLWVPYEQNTQQSPARGRKTALQPSHS